MNHWCRFEMPVSEQIREKNYELVKRCTYYLMFFKTIKVKKRFEVARISYTESILLVCQHIF